MPKVRAIYEALFSSPTYFELFLEIFKEQKLSPAKSRTILGAIDLESLNFILQKGYLHGPQSKYQVLDQGAFGGTGFLFLGRLGSQAST